MLKYFKDVKGWYRIVFLPRRACCSRHGRPVFVRVRACVPSTVSRYINKTSGGVLLDAVNEAVLARLALRSYPVLSPVANRIPRPPVTEGYFSGP